MKKLNFFKTQPKALRINVDEYLNRLGLKRQDASLAYLKALHKAHVFNIPFENLDIHYGQKIALDYHKVFKKVITNGRGGFCYELNGLLYHLLYHLGFDCYLISARVRNPKTKAYGKEFGHMAVAVDIDGSTWLADVGFGEAIIEPKQIKTNAIQVDYTKYWRFHQDPDENWILQVSNDAQVFDTKYLFTLKSRELIEFMEMCEYHQTSRDSIFTQSKYVTKPTHDGRIVLTDTHLKITTLGTEEESSILNEDEFLAKLDQHFGISFRQLIPGQ